MPLMKPACESKKTITAQNTFTDPMMVNGGDAIQLSIQGTFVATVTVQQSHDSGVNYEDIPDATYTAPAVKNGEFTIPVLVRAGVKTGGFTSGTVVVTLRKLA